MSALFGSTVVNKLRAHGFEDIFVPRSSNYDLRDPRIIVRLYKDARPQIVIHLARGGRRYRGEPGESRTLFYGSAAMGIHMMEYVRQFESKKFVAVGTICA